MSNNIKHLERDIMDCYEICKRELGYNPIRSQQMIKEHGALNTIKKLISKREPSEGFTTLYLAGRTELSFEYHVVKYADLFEEGEVLYCKEVLGIK